MKTTLLAALVAVTFSSAALAGEEPTFEQDRKAILAMAGEFAVTFEFRETLPLQPEYTAKSADYSESAHELVIVAEDTGKRIRLQHLLVADGRAIKHWAQIWTFEDTRVADFQGHNTWKMRDLPAGEVQGTWTQQVTQVDDSPRYESWGRWEHQDGVSTWTSHDTWRPLPRREHTKRKDYDVVSGTNRHVVTFAGWAHEQDNTKTIVRDGKVKPLAREWGQNTYRRVTDFDFTNARAKWEKDAAFWGTVVSVWDDVQNTRAELRIHDTFDVPALRKAIDAARKGPDDDAKGQLRTIIEEKLTKGA